MDYLVKAIKKLHPEAQFSYSDDNYETVKFDFIEGSVPTRAEIDAAIEQIKTADKAEAEQSASDKAALLAKLGITADEAKLLLS